MTRVEISLDAGETWDLADVYVSGLSFLFGVISSWLYSNYPEDLYRSVSFQSPVYGKLDLTDSDFC